MTENQPMDKDYHGYMWVLGVLNHVCQHFFGDQGHHRSVKHTRDRSLSHPASVMRANSANKD